MTTGRVAFVTWLIPLDELERSKYLTQFPIDGRRFLEIQREQDNPLNNGVNLTNLMPGEYIVKVENSEGLEVGRGKVEVGEGDEIAVSARPSKIWILMSAERVRLSSQEQIMSKEEA